MAKQYEQKPPTEEEALKASEAGLKLVTEQIEKSRAAQEKLNEAAKKGVEIAEDEKNELEKQADIQAKINSLKEQATTESQRLRELSDISRDITKELLGSEEKRNKILAERRGAQKAQFTQNIAQLAAAKDENDLVEISKRLTQEKNILTSNGGGLSLKDNINRQEEIDYLLELISLKQKENQLSAAGFDTSEASQEKIKQQLDEQNAIIDFSEKQLEIMQQKAELAAIIDKHSQSIISNITSAIDSTGDIFSKIPLMGGMIKGKFDELSETLKGKLTDAAAAFKEKFAQNLAAGQNSMAAMRNAVASVGPAISAAWAAAAPLLFLAALAIGVKRADEMEQAAIDMRKALGGSAADAKEMAKELAEAESAVKQIGGTLVDAADAAKTLRETLGTIEPITSGTVSTMVLLNKNLGIANEKSAEVIGLFQNLGGLTQQAAAGALLMTTEMAKAAGLSAETIVNDIADAAANGEDLYLTVKGGAKEIAKMAIQARLLGTSIESAVKSSKTLLDFEQSIQDELEASAILGMDLNFQKARELAYNGDIAGSQREIMNQLRGIQDIGSLTLYEKEALAKATGMEIADLTKMQRIQRQFPGIEEEKMNAAMKLADKYGDISKITDDMLSAEVQRAAQEEKMTTTLQQLKDGFAAIGVELAEVLLPLGQAFLFILRYTLLPTLRLIAATIKFIGDGFKSLISLFTDAEAPLSGMTKWLGIGAAILTLIIARTIIWKGVTMAVNGAVMVLRFTYLALLGVWQLLKGAGTIFTPGFWSNAAASAKGFFNNMGNMIRGVPKPPPVAPTVPAQAPAAGAGSRFGAMRQQVLERRAAGGGLNNRTAPTIAPTTTAPSQAPAPTQQANQNPARGASAINASQILAAAAAMIAFAVAIYILAKAFQEFDKVKDMPKTLALFGGAVLGMVITLGIAAALAGPLTPIIGSLAVVLLAFGASVLLISAGMYIAAKAFGVFIAAINNFGPALTSLSAGITAFAASPYIQFGIGLAALGIALTAFALLSPFILIGAGALMLLGTALSAINVNMDGLKSLTEAINSLGEVNAEGAIKTVKSAMLLGLGIAGLGILIGPLTRGANSANSLKMAAEHISIAISSLSGVQVGNSINVASASILLGTSIGILGLLLVPITIGVLAATLLPYATAPIAQAISYIAGIDIGNSLVVASTSVSIGTTIAILGLLLPGIQLGVLSSILLPIATLPIAEAISYISGVEIGNALTVASASISLGGYIGTLGLLLPLIKIGVVAANLLPLATFPIAIAFTSLVGVQVAGPLFVAGASIVLATLIGTLGLLIPVIGLGIIGAMLLVIAAENIQSAFTKIGNIDTAQIQNLIQSISPLRAALLSLAGLIFIATAITMGIPMLALAFFALAIVMPVVSNISKTFTELSTALTNIASSIPKIIEQIIRLTTTNFTPIYQLADAIFNLTDALSKLSMQSLLSLPMLSKINELTGVNILGSTNVPVKPVATAAVSLPTIPAQPTKETTVNKEAETQQFTKDLLAQIIGLRGDLNQGKVAVYLDGTKVMKELKGVDSRELVTDRPRR